MKTNQVLLIICGLFSPLFFFAQSPAPARPPPASAQAPSSQPQVVLLPNKFSDQGWSESDEEEKPAFFERIMSAISGRSSTGGAFHLPDDGSNFQGTDRAVAKTRASTSPVRTLSLTSLLAEFKPGQAKSDDAMRSPKHQPVMRKDWNFDRVKEEQDNVQVEGWIIATTKETDNDFHIILAADPALATQSKPDTWKLMNVEVSGLPPTGTAGRSDLVTARAAYKAHFVPPVPDTPTKTYSMPSPVHVRITGSIFFDVDHLSGVVGPGPLKPGTSWEIHPITKIEFLAN